MGMLKQVNAGQTGTYRYDALGRRVKKTWNYAARSGSAIYVYGTGGQILSEYKSETTPGSTETSTTHNIVMDGRIVARHVTGSLPWTSINRIEWLRRNHLSEVVVVDTLDLNWNTTSTSAGTYGQPFNSGGSDQFPGQKEDPESNLKDFGARHFSASLARWTTADSLTAQMYDPLSLNKYAYVRNDPVNMMDPDGRFFESPFVTLCNPNAEGEIVCNTEIIDRGPVFPNDTYQKPRKPDPCSADKRRFFDWLSKPLSGMAKDLNVDRDFLFALAAKEGGWNDEALDHNQPLNNPFGVNKIVNGQAAGNKSYSSVTDAVKDWESLFGDRVGGVKTMNDFINGLQHSGRGKRPYNSADPEWEEKLRGLYFSAQLYRRLCHVE